jgi:hypothetical protein
MTKQTASIKWYNKHAAQFGIGILSVFLACLSVSRAIDTASIGEYLLGLALLIFAITEFVKSVRKGYGKK